MISLILLGVGCIAGAALSILYFFIFIRLRELGHKISYFHGSRQMYQYVKLFGTEYSGNTRMQLVYYSYFLSFGVTFLSFILAIVVYFFANKVI